MYSIVVFRDSHNITHLVSILYYVQICSVHSSSDSTSEVHDVRYQLLQLLQQIVSGAIFVAIDVQATAFALVLFLSG